MRLGLGFVAAQSLAGASVNGVGPVQRNRLRRTEGEPPFSLFQWLCEQLAGRVLILNRPLQGICLSIQIPFRGFR
jgi:hypothetical protein